MLRRGVLSGPSHPGVAEGKAGAALCILCSGVAGLLHSEPLAGAPIGKAGVGGATPETPVTPGMLGTPAMPGMAPGTGGRPRLSQASELRALGAAADDGAAAPSCARPPGTRYWSALPLLIATELEERLQPLQPLQKELEERWRICSRSSSSPRSFDCRWAPTPSRPLTNCPVRSSIRLGALVDEAVGASAAGFVPTLGWTRCVCWERAVRR